MFSSNNKIQLKDMWSTLHALVCMVLLSCMMTTIIPIQSDTIDLLVETLESTNENLEESEEEEEKELFCFLIITSLVKSTIHSGIEAYHPSWEAPHIDDHLLPPEYC